MGLTNAQYDLLSYRYDSKRRNAGYALEERIRKVYAEIPQIKEIDDTIASESIRRARLAIKGDKSALDNIDDDNNALRLKKEKLLVAHGYPSDYLTMKYECPICKDTGSVNGRPCDCYKKALSELVYNDSNLAGILKEENFENFNYSLFSDSDEDRDPNIDRTPRENITKVVEITKEFIREFDNRFENLLIYGNTGVGKTFLCSCIAKELLDTSHTVVYYTAYKFFKYLEDDKFRPDEADESLRLGSDYLVNCDLLILDDLGTELTNSFTNSALYSVLNERELRKHSTVISTNLGLGDINRLYSERIFSRLSKDYTFLKVIGKDIRCL
ncbi:MAG: ATP-binding protein [Lachnospiraceae bacterium]|nr:ATP-binding protein [Lachnospiraceae bacterium]